MNNRVVGASYELAAANYLQKQGLTIVERNFRCRIGEIDLIARDGKYLVFVEVKQRSSAKAGFAQQAVGLQKQKVISKVSDYYRMIHHLVEDTPVRFDVIAFNGQDLVWMQNAFSYIHSFR